MAEDYEREKLGNAVHSLAASAEPIQKRLEYAFLSMHTLMAHGFVDPNRAADYDEIIKRLTTDKAGNEQAIVPDVCQQLSDNEAEEIARLIVDLNTRLHHDRIYGLEDALAAAKRR